MGGTGREYLKGRLRKGGHFALLAAVERGDLSAYAAAEEAGYVTRKPTLETGSQNMLRRRMFAVRNALRAGGEPLPQDEALAPAEEPRHEESTVKTVVGGFGDLPCLYCSHPQAQLARREIADVFIENQLGNGNRRPAPNGALPKACCRRHAVTMTAAALIG
jgi:hypothetical protein